MLNKTKTPTTIARPKMAKENALKWTSQTGKEPNENNSEKNKALQIAKKNNKTTKTKSSDTVIEEGLAKSSKKQHSENTDKWYLCKAGSFSYGESPQTPPLEGTSLHRWNNSAERPWGIWACLPPVYNCVWNHPATGCDMWPTPKKHTMRRETLGNTNQNKTTRRAGYKKVYAPLPPKGSIQN